jgi:hypothetical protein
MLVWINIQRKWKKRAVMNYHHQTQSSYSPGSLILCSPVNVDKAKLVLKTKDVYTDDFTTARNKVDVTRLMKKFKLIAKMVGKLKAAQNQGTKKRTAVEEALRLAALAK